MLDFGSDNYFMAEALKEAKKAYEKEEVPVGAVVVESGKIIARAHNQSETLKDATAHAEMIALTQAAAAVGDWRLTGATLYVTMEPCVMCGGAIILSRISRVVYGFEDKRFGACGSFCDIFSSQKMSPEIQIEKGVLALEGLNLLQQFFKERRAHAKGISDSV